MNILIISQYFFPESFEINNISMSWSKLGHHIDVITGMPNYPFGEIYEGYKGKLYENYNGINIYRTNCRPRYKGAFNLALNYLDFMCKGKNTIKKNITINPDIVFCYMPSPIFQLSPSIFAKNKFKCPLVVMCCDQWPESIKNKGLKSGPLFWIVGNYCKRAFSKCDFIFNIAPSFSDYNHVVNKVPYCKMKWLLQPIKDSFSNTQIAQLEKRETINIFFTGNLGFAQNVSDIIMAYYVTKIPNLFIHIYGDGSCAQDCKNLVTKLDVGTNVIFHGKVPFDYLQKEFSKADACLLTLSGKSKIGNTIPSKLTNYMSAGKMVLGAINGDARTLIETVKCGICTDPDDYLKLADLIREFCNNLLKYKLYGLNGRKYYEQFGTIEYFNSLVLDKFLDLTEENKHDSFE